MKLRFFAAALLVFLCLATPGSANDCAQNYLQLAKSAATSLDTRFQLHTGGKPGALGQFRDWLTKTIMRLKRRGYPSLAMDDATPLKANLFAKNALGNQAAFNGAPFDAATIKGEIEELLKSVEGYPAELKEYIRETATKAARLDAMQAANESGLQTTHNIELEMPVASVSDKGEISVAMKPRTWATDTKFKIEMDELHRDIRDRLGEPLFGVKKSEAFVLDHINNVKKLETYLNEFRDTQTDLVGRGLTAEVDPESKALYDRMAAIYSNKKGWLKPEYSVPAWAFNKLRWQQLMSELRTIYQKDIPRMADKAKTSEVIQFMKNLSPEELKALGVSKLADSVGFFGRNKYVRILTAALSGSSGIGWLGAQAYDLFYSEPVEKEKCAAETTDQRFSDCLQTYLQEKFTVDMIKSVIFSQEAFLDPKGKISDPKVRKEVEDAIERRKSYVGSTKQKEENQEALAKAIRDLQAAQDPSSEAYRDKVVMAPRNELFVFGATGTDTGTTTYLGATHPGQLAKNRVLVMNILNEADADQRGILLMKLRENGANGLADDVVAILDDRQDFLDGKFTPGRRRVRRKLGAPGGVVMPAANAPERPDTN
jgi:hypothetical protein